MSYSWTRTLTGSVSALIIWSAHFALVYSLLGIGCEESWDQRPVAGSNLLTTSIIAATLPALALIGWIGWGGWRGQRESRIREDAGEPAARGRFLGLLTVTVALLAFISTLMTAVPSVMLPPCEG